VLFWWRSDGSFGLKRGYVVSNAYRKYKKRLSWPLIIKIGLAVVSAATAVIEYLKLKGR